MRQTLAILIGCLFLLGCGAEVESDNPSQGPSKRSGAKVDQPTSTGGSKQEGGNILRDPPPEPDDPWDPTEPDTGTGTTG
jgi:hypothetical protein